jgi:hypothetical protein
MRGDHLRDIAAIHILHGEVELTGGGGAEVIHRHHGGVIELGHQPCLALEALGEAGVFLLDPRRQNLDGDGAVEIGLHPAIHRPHPTTTEDLLDGVTRHQVLEFCRRRWFPAESSARGARRGSVWRR